jgi:hypothetical protein
MLALLIERVGRVQDRLGRPLVLENITAYLGFTDDTIPEYEFLNELTARTGAALLLDLNDVHVNSRNLDFDALEFLLALRASAVGQLYLAGHTRRSDFILDSHVGPVPAR